MDPVIVMEIKAGNDVSEEDIGKMDSDTFEKYSEYMARQ